MNTVSLHTGAYQEMARHLGTCYPYEGCGFLLGLGNERKEILKVLPVRNMHEGDHRRRYRITPEDYRMAEQLAGSAGMELLGIYHSHPDHPARPSEEDRLQAVPFFSYIIARVSNSKVDRVTSWQLNDEGQLKEEKVEIT
jgi:proteasome lid subunit RPN8/RPN11